MHAGESGLAENALAGQLAEEAEDQKLFQDVGSPDAFWRL